MGLFAGIQRPAGIIFMNTWRNTSRIGIQEWFPALAVLILPQRVTGYPQSTNIGIIRTLLIPFAASILFSVETRLLRLLKAVKFLIRSLFIMQKFTIVFPVLRMASFLILMAFMMM